MVEGVGEGVCGGAEGNLLIIIHVYLCHNEKELPNHTTQICEQR